MAKGSEGPSGSARLGAVVLVARGPKSGCRARVREWCSPPHERRPCRVAWSWCRTGFHSRCVARAPAGARSRVPEVWPRRSGPCSASAAGSGSAGQAKHSPTRPRDEVVRQWERERSYISVQLPQDLGNRFYHGFANQALWPLFHQFPDQMVYDSASWPAYVEANERFRDAVLARVQDGDLVWVHDYHLMLLPRLLRQARPGLAIGFFLHIPFPSSDIFRILPGREELLRGLLGADLVAFQTHGDVQHFRSSVQRILGLSTQMDRVIANGRSVRVEARPIGIAPARVHARAAGPGGPGRARTPARALRRPAAAARGGPARLHEGHPRAAAHLSPAARADAGAARAGSAGPGRGPFAREDPALPRAAQRGERPRRRDQRQVLDRGLDAGRLPAPLAAAAGAGGAVRGGRGGLGDAAARRHEPRGQGVRRPARARAPASWC